MSSTVSESETIIKSPKVDPNKSSYSPRITSSPFSQSINESEVYENDVSSRPYLPECWTDSKRMSSLFSQFRAREANPEGFDLKINFWSKYINKWSLQTRRVVFTVDDVRNAFQRGSQRPQTKCIQLVMSHLKRNKSLIYFDDYIQLTKSNDNKNWINWGLNTLVVKPFSIGWSLIAGNKEQDCSEEILTDIKDETKFICVETLQVMSEEFIKFVTHLENINCIRFDSLFAKSKDKLKINYDTFDVIIANLELENKIKTFVDNGIKIIKFGKNAEIKELDIGLIRLESAKEILENEIQKLDDEIKSIEEEARVCIRNKNREKAILLLRRKKRVENKMSKKDTQLDNVDLLIEQLSNASSHNLILQAFQKAADALKLAHNPEDVENTMSDIEETLDVVSDIVSDVSRPLVSVDNQDIDNELDELLNELEQNELPKASIASHRQQNDEQLEQLNRLSLNDSSPEPEKSKKMVSTLEAA